MEMKNFIAKYNLNGIERTIRFDGKKFDKAKAEQLLAANDIKNFFFFFDENEFVDMPDGSVMISGEVGFDITLDRVKPYLDEGRRIIVDSPGGSLWEGLRIYDYIKEFTPDAAVGVLGLCASAITLPLIAAKKENRSASGNSRLLIHNPWTFSVGDAETLRIDAEMLQVEEDNLVAIYSRELGKTPEEIKARMKPERIMTSQEAFDFGIIGEIKGNGEPTKVDEPIINNNENEKKEEMEKAEAKKALNVLAKAFNDIKSFFGPSNLVLQDVTGVELDFGPDVTSDEQIVVGIKGVTANGQPAEGDYTMPDERTLKFTAGELMEIVLPVDDSEIEQLTAENSALKEEVANLKKENGILAQKNTEAFAKVKNIETEFNKFKNEFSQEDKIEHDAPTSGGQNSGKEKFSYKPKNK